MFIEVSHHGRRRTVIRIPKAGYNAFCAGNQKVPRQIHDAFFTPKPACSRLARGKGDEVGPQSGSPDLAGLPETVIGSALGGQYEAGTVRFDAVADAVRCDVNDFEVSERLSSERRFRGAVAREQNAACTESLRSSGHLLFGKWKAA